jgi:hypothetical protein
LTKNKKFPTLLTAAALFCSSCGSDSNRADTGQTSDNETGSPTSGWPYKPEEPTVSASQTAPALRHANDPITFDEVYIFRRIGDYYNGFFEYNTEAGDYIRSEWGEPDYEGTATLYNTEWTEYKYNLDRGYSFSMFLELNPSYFEGEPLYNIYGLYLYNEKGERVRFVEGYDYPFGWDIPGNIIKRFGGEPPDNTVSPYNFSYSIPREKILEIQSGDKREEVHALLGNPDERWGSRSQFDEYSLDEKGVFYLSVAYKYDEEFWDGTEDSIREIVEEVRIWTYISGVSIYPPTTEEPVVPERYSINIERLIGS